MNDGSAAISKTAGVPDPLIGRVVNDRFKISALIARGGMGKVYRAEQAPLGRVCALKVLNPNYAGEQDPEFHKRFFLEASIASKLTHPNTVTIFDYGRTEDDVYYMAMEYLEGHTLHRAIREAGHFPEERAAHIARQICRALREAHSLGVIHRDLKPANIFLVEHGDETDFVKILDFGLVKNVSETKTEDLTQTGLFMGSPKYMAPEQIRGDRVDARTDIYALGIIMYEMMAGKVPFDRPNSVNILMAHVNEEPLPIRQMNPNTQLTPAFEEVIARAMAKDPDKRFRSMDEVLAALKRIGGMGNQTFNGLATGEFRALAISASGPRGVTADTGSGPAVDGLQSLSGSGSVVSAQTRPEELIPVATFSSPPPNPGGSKGVLVTAVLGALAVAGVVGYFALHPVGNAVSAASAASATPAAAAVASAPVASAALVPADTIGTPKAAALVKVRVNTDPDGATVKEDGVELCSSTPCDLLYKGADADPARDHKLTLTRAGYRVEVRALKVGDSPLLVKLTKAPDAPVPHFVAPQGPAAQAPRNDPAPVPTGYKTDLPY
ncbi:MAG TPA: serine/threonine-protein kinase [Polyangiaceae bacterium]|jgi:serine/threonine-protein kinase|nr:serine/threonine-protein kinase [Polyangiaceae bacterium]